ICDDCFEGFALPHDSIIPDVNPWSIEGRLPYTYYDPNVELGKSLLDDAGFEDVDDDGFREAPDGSSFQVKIECYLDDTALQVGDMTADALSALGINAVSVPTDYYDYLPRLVYHGDYDIVFFEATFTNYDIDGLGHHFLSENADVPYLNLFNFKNTTVDIWAKKLIYATTFDEVQEASDELQKLLVYECPAIVCYQKFFVNAYRNDRFEGFIDIQSNNWWTYFNVKLRASFGGHYSGTIRCGLYDISTLNLLGSATGSEWEIFNLLYDSLIKLDPDNIDLNWLCENYTVQTHEDNPNVPDGRSKITFEIVQNATWTDGYPLTADDIAFTMNFRKNIEGSAYGEDFDGVEVAYAPTPYLVVVEFSTESIWNLHDISYKPILPKHIFQEIDVDDWEEWNPAPPDEPMVTSGPFNITEYIHGEFIEMTRFDDYFRGLDYTSQTNTTETQDYGRIMSGVLMGTISAVVTVITGVYILRKKEKA
ncbi:MAG: ABC transporter substrate-binding protein, partial [Candidatus Thorarchaeota archaeon]